MTDYLRVRDNDTGHELSVPRSHYDANAKAYTVVDKPAVDAAGDPLPVKHRTTVAKAAEEKQSKTGGQQATTTKEI